MITPIDTEQESRVVAVANDYLRRASVLYGCRFAQLPIQFDLRGRSSGMYKVSAGDRQIRYNPHIFSKYFDDCLQTTVPHEVAHYVTDVMYGLHRIRPHGAEWRAVMLDFGVAPRVTADFDLDGIPQRRQTRHRYHCACASVQISARRHNAIRRGQSRYLCRQCHTEITQG